MKIFNNELFKLIVNLCKRCDYIDISKKKPLRLLEKDSFSGRELNHALINCALNRVLRTFRTLPASSVLSWHNVSRAMVASVRRRYTRSAGTRLSMTVPAPLLSAISKGIITLTYATLEYRPGFVRPRELSSVRSRRFSIRLVPFYSLLSQPLPNCRVPLPSPRCSSTFQGGS